jgi:hypothetical protein
LISGDTCTWKEDFDMKILILDINISTEYNKEQEKAVDNG